MNSPAQSPTFGNSEVSVDGYTFQVQQACEWLLKSSLPDVEKFLIILLLRNGLRVSEICNAAAIRVIDKYSVYVWCTKNATWRKCLTAEASELLAKPSVQSDLKIWNRNRQYYYRAMKGLIVGVETSRTENEAVTHAARNIAAQQAYQATESMQAVRASIGNATDNASARYINRRQRRALQTGGAISPISGTTSPVTSTSKGVIRKRRH